MTAEAPVRADETPEPTWYSIWLPRMGIALLVGLAIFWGASWVFSSTVDFIITLILSFFIAFAMLPAVDYLSNKRGWKRGLATALTLVIGIIMVLIFALAIAQVFVDQIVALVDQAPVYVQQTVDWVNETFDANYSVDGIIEELGGYDAVVRAGAETALSGVLGFTSSILGLVFRGLTIGLFVFYILADLPKLRNTLLKNLPPVKQGYVDTFFTITIQKVGGYVYSRLVLAAASAAFHFVIFMILDLPYALAMALWVGLVSQFVPSVGTYLAGIVPVVIALMEDPVKAVWVIVAVTIYQQIENYLLSPKVTANTMDLHPAVAFGSAIIGGSLLGAAGALLALPVAATITALVQTYATDYAVIDSSTIEGHEAYEQRMAAKKEAKKAKKQDKNADQASDE
ncbi:MAG: AI-2E family transporter [Acidimicrobiia bacterium]